MDPWEKFIIEANMRASELGPIVIILLLLMVAVLYRGKQPAQNEAPGAGGDGTVAE